MMFWSAIKYSTQVSATAQEIKLSPDYVLHQKKANAPAIASTAHLMTCDSKDRQQFVYTSRCHLHDCPAAAALPQECLMSSAGFLADVCSATADRRVLKDQSCKKFDRRSQLVSGG
jgi:hypothetical protein